MACRYVPVVTFIRLWHAPVVKLIGWRTFIPTLGKHGEADSVQSNRNQAEPSQMQNSYVANSEVVIAYFYFYNNNISVT